MTDKSQPVLIDIQDNVAVVTLNAPETKNALSEAMIDGLVAALETTSRDMAVRCIVLTGAGAAFCSGGNIKEMRDRTGYAGGGPAHGWRSMLNMFQRIPRAFLDHDIPVIAAIDGPAMGAGCDIAAMCDIRLASDRSTFAETFIKLGVVSGDGGSWFLTRAIGYARAAEMTFTGDPIDAATARDWGLVSRVVPADDLLPEALALARRIARHPPNSLRLAKRLLREAAEGTPRSALELAAAMQGVALHTRDQAEAVKATIERRAGEFIGE